MCFKRRKLWNKDTSLFALSWKRRLRLLSWINPNSELILSQIDADAGCASTTLATVCSSGTQEPLWSHHMYAGRFFADSSCCCTCVCTAVKGRPFPRTKRDRRAVFLWQAVPQQSTQIHSSKPHPKRCTGSRATPETRSKQVAAAHAYALL